jgi:DNA-binding MarR family transcriptional regulator
LLTWCNRQITEIEQLVVDPLKDFPGYALRRASSVAIAGLARRLSALDLRPAEATVLMVIQANPNITQSEIGRLLDVASANMAPLVSRLEDRDLIEREPVDGRSHGLTLSEAGRALTLRVKKTIVAHEEEILCRIPASHRAAFMAGLHALWNSEQS